MSDDYYKLDTCESIFNQNLYHNFILFKFVLTHQPLMTTLLLKPMHIVYIYCSHPKPQSQLMINTKHQ